MRIEVAIRRYDALRAAFKAFSSADEIEARKALLAVKVIGFSENLEINSALPLSAHFWKSSANGNASMRRAKIGGLARRRWTRFIGTHGEPAEILAARRRDAPPLATTPGRRRASANQQAAGCPCECDSVQMGNRLDDIN
jgi:hypothetical protein